MSGPDPGPEGERLQKVLARAGVGSRRACDELISAGRVTVNGRTAEPGERVDVRRDAIEVDGAPIGGLEAGLMYLALHKPVGVVTTVRDTHRRQTVADLVPPEPRVFPVGRLDKDTSGLLFLTNDGDFANRVTHPRYQVRKMYVAEIHGAVKTAQLKRLQGGVELTDGTASAERVRVRASSGRRTLVELTVREGRNRLVRRMLGAVGLEVSSLTRVAVGDVGLGRLPVGKWRKLTHEEVLGLMRPSTA